jgi:hypothetical protein
MAFGLFKNPFEALSSENQSAMVKELEEIKNYFFKGNTIVQAVNELGNLLKANIKAQNTLTQILLKRQEKQMADKDQKEMIKTAKIFGPALERIVGAIKDFSQLPEEAVDKFILAIEKIGNAFMKMKDIGKTIMETAKGLMLMAGAIILFGIALIIALPLYLIGMIAAPIVFLVILGFVYLFTKALGDKTGKDILDGAKGLMYMAGAIILFGIALFLAGIVYAELWKGLIGMVPIILTIMAMIFLFSLMDGLSGTIKDGIEALLMMVAVIGLTGLILYLASFIYAELWNGFAGMIAILLTIGALVGLMFLIDMLSDTIMDGVKALAIMVGIVALTGLILFLAGKFYEELWEGAVASWPILVVIGALIGLMFAINTMKSTIYEGAKALFIMVLAVGVTALILYVISGLAEEMVAGLGASWPILILIAALVGVMFLISLVEKEVLKGSLALGVIAVAMVILAGALMMIKSVDWTLDDTLSLSALVVVLALVGTLLGVAMESGLLPLLGAAAMAAIGVSIIILAEGLKIYKEAKFTADDAILLSATVVALAVIGTVLGNPFTIGFTLAGASAMVLIGVAMEPLTQGLKTFKESGWTDSDGVNFEKAIASIVKGFSIVADDDLKKEYGIKASAYEIFWGIRSLAGIGNILTEMARGIQEFANMKFTEYEVVKDKDGNAKVQVKEIRKLTDAEIQNAGVNFGKVLDAILMPISRVGMMEMMSEGWFSGGVVSKGIESLTGLGNIMTSMAKGIQDFADLKFTRYEVVNAGTPEAKIVPVEIVPLNETHFQNAGIGFGKILDAIIDPISRVGRAEMDSDGWFSDGVVKKGIEALTGIGNIMTELAKGIQSFANLEFTSYEVVNAGTPDAKIVPKGIFTLSDGDFWKVKDNFNGILNAFFDPIIWAGQKYDKNESEVDDAIEYLPPMIEVVNKLAGAMKPWMEVQDPWKAGNSFNYFVDSILNAFSKPNSWLLLSQFGSFTSNAEILINGSSQLEKTAESFERIADAFGEMKEHINGMEIERLTQVTRLMGFLDGLANGDSDDIVADIGEAITQGMETLTEILEEIKTQLAAPAPAAGGIVADAAAAVGIGPGTSEGGAAAKPAEQKQQPVDMSAVVNAINSLKTTLTSQGIKVQNNALAR